MKGSSGSLYGCPCSTGGGKYSSSNRKHYSSFLGQKVKRAQLVWQWEPERWGGKSVESVFLIGQQKTWRFYDFPWTVASDDLDVTTATAGKDT